jgi:hypothetical protein
MPLSPLLPSAEDLSLMPKLDLHADAPN